ncbi:MAG TPA: DUF222 domain-containing protein [Marmoricola sp.]|nr:DUF222 domain-containing protein [Marmoricola sp.]
MFDQDVAPKLTTQQLSWFVGALRTLDTDVADPERIDQVRLLEELKSAASATQATVTTTFVASQKAAQVEAGVPANQVGKGIAAQVGLAKRESPARAKQYVGWAGILSTELPGTLEELQAGRITEWRAKIVAKETIWLDRADRLRIDAELAPRLESLGDRQVEAAVKKRAYELDPHGYLERIARAEKDRRVTLRPAPDTMSILSGLLPVAQGVAVFAALTRQADSLRAGGDERSKGQIMADTLVERVTGQVAAPDTSVEVKIVMTDQALFNHGDGSSEPAHAEGYGPIPADLARRIARSAAEGAKLWLRRLYADPSNGQLVAMDSQRRLFADGLAEFLLTRDQFCRTPWCDAPVRHSDHVVAVADGGETSAANGQGLCEACNYAKQAAGWRARASGGGAGEQVETTTPTGHTYRGRPPDPPGAQRQALSLAEAHFRRLIEQHAAA